GRGTDSWCSSCRPQERSEVADGPDVRQLVGVDDHSDACDLTAGDIERHHADEPLLCVEKTRSRAAVDLVGAEGHARKAGNDADLVVDDRARDTGSPAQRPRERWNLAAAVGGQLHVMSEQRLEAGEVAVLGGGEEPSCQFVALLARRLEAGSALLDLAPGP